MGYGACGVWGGVWGGGGGGGSLAIRMAASSPPPPALVVGRWEREQELFRCTGELGGRHWHLHRLTLSSTTTGSHAQPSTPTDAQAQLFTPTHRVALIVERVKVLWLRRLVANPPLALIHVREAVPLSRHVLRGSRVCGGAGRRSAGWGQGRHCMPGANTHAATSRQGRAHIQPAAMAPHTTAFNHQQPHTCCQVAPGARRTSSSMPGLRSLMGPVAPMVLPDITRTDAPSFSATGMLSAV